MRQLIVYLNNTRAGTLAQEDSGLINFTYDQAWLDNPKTMPVVAHVSDS